MNSCIHEAKLGKRNREREIVDTQKGICFKSIIHPFGPHFKFIVAFIIRFQILPFPAPKLSVTNLPPSISISVHKLMNNYAIVLKFMYFSQHDELKKFPYLNKRVVEALFFLKKRIAITQETNDSFHHD